MNGTPVVVGYDGSERAAQALDWALAEAARLRAPLRVAYVLEWPTQLAAIAPGPPLYPDQGSRRAAEDQVRSAAETAARQRPEVPVGWCLRVGAAVPELVAEASSARMVVLGHRARHGLAGLLLGSVGAAVSAYAHCPVVIVHDRQQAATGPQTCWGLDAPDQVLVGFDDSACAARALDVAFRAAAARRTGVRVLHAWRPPVAHRAATGPDTDGCAGSGASDPVERLELLEHLAVVDAIQPWRRRFPRVPVTVDLVADDAGPALIAASRGAQLAVVGSCGHGGLRAWLSRSVSRQLVYQAGCPLVVVHTAPRDEVGAPLP